MTDQHGLVLGGGLAGLACGHELAARGRAVTVVEREPQVGGMAASFVEDGDESWSYDYGPHRFYGPDQEIAAQLESLLGENIVTARRVSRIALFDKLFDYPLVLSNVLRNMPRGLLARALFDYLRVRTADTLRLSNLSDDNFEGWVTRRFGRTLYRVFFGEYTEKVLGLPADQLTAAWGSQRITPLSLWDVVVKSLLPRKSGPASTSKVSEFLYPKRGGIGEIARAYARRIEGRGGQVLVGAPAVKVYRDGRRVVGVQYGAHHRVDVEADDYVSTIPVTALVEALSPNAPAEVLDASRQLEYVSIVFVYLKVDRESVSPDSWIYLPEKRLTVHRISEFKNFSTHSAPRDKTMICAEITCRRGDDIWRAQTDELRDLAVRDLSVVGLLEPGQVLDAFVKRIPHAYPVYSVGYERVLAPVKDYVAGLQNIRTAGRQGKFGYTNMYESIASGRDVANEVAGGGAADRPAAVARTG